MTDRRLLPVAPLHAYVSAHYSHPWWTVRVTRYDAHPGQAQPAEVETYELLTAEEATDVLAGVSARLLLPRAHL